MRKISLLSVVVILAIASADIVCGVRAYAQSGQPTPTINLTAEQRHVLKENLLKDPNVKKVTKRSLQARFLQHRYT